MSDPFVYRSRDPQVVGSWKAACDALTAYVAETDAALARAGLNDRKVYRSTNSWSYGAVRGIAIDDGAEVPRGWRMTTRYAVPDKRIKAGKEIAATLDAITHPGAPTRHLPGMPEDAINRNGSFSGPSVRVLENGAAIYAEWSMDPDGRESFMHGKAVVDHSLWEPAPLSEYYAAREASEKERAGAAAMTSGEVPA
jgi:hypothetical protein